MAVSASQLVPDIYELLAKVASGDTKDLPPELLADFGAKIAVKVQAALTGKNKQRKPKTLYMSEIGKPCKRQLWYEVNKDTIPGLKGAKEQLLPSTLIKFIYGDVLEELVLLLAKAAGHDVSDEQKECEIPLPNGWKIRGRMDAKIDGEIVDVKSASSQSFERFRKGLQPTADHFGYIPQLQAYNDAEGVPPGTLTSFIAIDKQHGHIVRDVHTSVLNVLSPTEKVELVAAMESPFPPDRAFESAPTSYGNKCLGTECSYCSWKHECWKDANGGKGIRTFLYSRKPVHMVSIKTVPNVPEIKDGKIVGEDDDDGVRT